MQDLELNEYLKGHFYSEYIYPTRQRRLVFDIEASDIDTSKWTNDGKSGFWLAFGLGLITDNDNHYDLVMCEYVYQRESDQEQDVRCFDRHWDNGEVY